MSDKKRVTLYVESAIWQQFRMWCLREGVSASEVINAHMRDVVGKPDDGAPIPYPDRVPSDHKKDN